MKASELRIGNYIFNLGILTVIDCIEENRLSTKEGKLPYSFYNEIQPIPLTEEWFLKFGFEKAENNWFNKKYLADIQDSVIQFSVNISSGSASICDMDDEAIPAYIGKEIKYVHQLQNLYFALTGNELEIK